MALVLAVDDSLDSLLALKEFLLSQGFHCRLASSGKMALDLLTQETFDLIISDYQMEDGDGVWLLKELKQLQVPTKCIIVTGESWLDAKFFTQHGADGFCHKPLIWHKLRVEMDKVLGS